MDFRTRVMISARAGAVHRSGTPVVEMLQALKAAQAVPKLLTGAQDQRVRQPFLEAILHAWSVRGG